MSHSRIKVVFFDAAGTLFKIRGSVADVYLHYAKNYGIPSTPELKTAINKGFTHAFAQAPPPVFAVSQPEKLQQCERLWWFDVVHAVFYRVGMFEGFDDFFDEVFEAFASGEHWRVDDEVLPILQNLKDLDYELGIISNFDTRLFPILECLSLRSYFDTVTISSLAQAVKPSRQIFHYALREHAIDPQEALHVGDSFKEDWEGATNAGLHGVLMSPTNREPSINSAIQSFKELPGVLEKLDVKP